MLFTARNKHPSHVRLLLINKHLLYKHQDTVTVNCKVFFFFAYTTSPRALCMSGGIGPCIQECMLAMVMESCGNLFQISFLCCTTTSISHSLPVFSLPSFAIERASLFLILIHSFISSGDPPRTSNSSLPVIYNQFIFGESQNVNPNVTTATTNGQMSHIPMDVFVSKFIRRQNLTSFLPRFPLT